MTLFHRTILLSPNQRSLLIGILTFLAGQLYFSVWAEGFRMSASAVLYPLLLLTLKRESHRPDTGLITGLCVMSLRTGVDMIHGIPFLTALVTEYPGGVFYLCYDALLCLLLKDRRSTGYRMLWISLFVSDLISNTVNFLLSSHLTPRDPKNALISLAWLALFRSAAATLLLWTANTYRQLLLQEEHELRYRRLFLLTANLKTELYFLKKDAEEAEAVMAHAYKLYEQLRQEEVPQPLQDLALSIARDVHEIKKDNLRIIRGLESDVAEAYDHESMALSDLLNILTHSTQQLLGQQRAEIRLVCSCPKNISIREHYRVLSVLKNLVTNAVEAIQASSGQGTVQVDTRVEDNQLYLTVADDGPGISKRGLRMLFTVGYSTKFHPDTGNIGRGVGLPAVQFIIDELEGTLDVQSQPGQGTTFQVVFPLNRITGGNT